MKRNFLIGMAGISLAFVLAFAIAFAACDTGTSNGGRSTTGDQTGGGSVPPVSRIFKSANGKFELTITERLLASTQTQTAFTIAAPTSGEVFYYGLRVEGAPRSQGLVTAGTPTWRFESRAGKEFTIPVSVSGESLAFGAATITADDGTEIPIPALTLAVGSEEKGGNTAPIITITSEQRLRNALGTAEAPGDPGVYRIVSSFSLTSDLVVHANQHIVVGGTADDDDIGQYSEGGPLFNANYTSNAFSIGKKLTLESGATLTIARGAAVNATGGGELHVSAGAKVGVGVDVSGESVDIGSGLSSLHSVGTGILYFADNATLAVNASVDTSKVKLESTDGEITLLPATKLVVVDASAATPIIGNGTAEGVSVIIEIPNGSAATVAVKDVYTTVDATTADSSVTTAFDTAKTAVNNASSTPTVSSLADLNTALAGPAVKITYTGNEAITSEINKSALTLVIAGAVPSSSGAIRVGTLEITGEASLSTSGAITADTLTVTGTLEVTGASVTGTATSSRIVVQGTGTITGAGATNFYYNDGTTAITVPITAGTYTWDGTLNENAGGWKGTAGAPNTDASLAGTTWEQYGVAAEGEQGAVFWLTFTANTVTADTYAGGVVFTDAPYNYSGGIVTITPSVEEGFDEPWVGTVTGNTMTFPDGKGGTVTVTKQGTVDNTQVYLEDGSLANTLTGTIGGPANDTNFGTVTNGKLALAFPSTTVMDAAIAAAVPFAWEAISGLTPAPSNTKSYRIDLGVVNGNNESIGKIKRLKIDGNSARHDVEYWYFTGPCTITGSFPNANDITTEVSINAVHGWNEIYWLYPVNGPGTLTPTLDTVIKGFTQGAEYGRI